MGIGTFLSRIFGLVREQVFAIFFGAGLATDAFQVAYRIPNLLRDLFAEGAMSAALVPNFVKAREQETQKRAWRMAGLVFRILLVLSSVIALMGMIFSEDLVALYASSFKDIPGQFELTVLLTQIMFPFFPLVVMAAAFMAILNASGVFFLPSFASALFNVASIVVGLLCMMLFKHYGYPGIMGMAVGVLVGGMVQAGVQLPKLYSQGYRFPKKEASDPVWHQEPALRRMMVMMVPGIIGMAAMQINILVNTILATSQGPGAVSWLNYAFRLNQFPIGVFGVSLAAASLPRLSEFWSQDNPTGFESTLRSSLKQVFAINLPAAAGLIALGVPIVELIFQYGRFTEESTQATAIALAAYASGLVFYSSTKVLVPACYAAGNTRLPVLSSVVSVVSNIVLNLSLVGPLGYWGLALGTSLAAAINFSFLIFWTRRLLAARGQVFQVRDLLGSMLRYFLVAVAMGAFTFGLYQVFLMVPAQMGWDLVGADWWIRVAWRLVQVGVLVAVGVGFIVVSSRVFQLPEMLKAVELITKKLKNMLVRSKK